MANIDFPLGYNESKHLPRTRRVLKNLFNAGGNVLQRPGIAQLSTTSRVARGSFEWNGSLYQVASQDLIKIDVADGSFTVIGTIDGSAQIDSDVGFVHAVIIVKGGKAYTLDKSDVLTEITDANFQPSESIAFINTRFVYIPSNGDPAIYSDAGNGASIQANAFFDAEELPDKNKVVFNNKNILVIGGSDSFELFRNIPGAASVFTRLNARIDFGYIGGLQRYQDTYIFIGREHGESVGIYAIGQGAATKLSNEGIDTILSGYTEQELSRAITNRFKWKGYDLATFVLDRHSFLYSSGEWSLIDTQIDNESGVWQGGFITQFQQEYYASFAGKIGRLDEVNSDYGSSFERLVEMGFESDRDFSAGSLTLGIAQGFNSKAGSVALQLSGDGVLWSEPFYRKTADIGQYSDQLTWSYPGGLGYYRKFMGIRISTTENIEFSASGLEVGI